MKQLLLGLAALASTSASAAAPVPGFLGTSGTQIVDGDGKPVILRGMGLGGWMLQEGYMLKLGELGQQHVIHRRLAELVGQDTVDEFQRAWLDHHMTKADMDALGRWGFNSVRLPMHYALFLDPKAPAGHRPLERGRLPPRRPAARLGGCQPHVGDPRPSRRPRRPGQRPRNLRPRPEPTFAVGQYRKPAADGRVVARNRTALCRQSLGRRLRFGERAKLGLRRTRRRPRLQRQEQPPDRRALQTHHRRDPRARPQPSDRHRRQLLGQ